MLNVQIWAYDRTLATGREDESPMSSPHELSEATKYVRSLKDSVKRRFAGDYLDWIVGGKSGAMPGRGALSPTLAKAVCINLDALS